MPAHLARDPARDIMRRMFWRDELIPERFRRASPESSQDPLFRIFIHNDDATPMDFVVHVLVTIFLLPAPNAEHVMLTAHLTGSAYVQTLPAPEARRRINQACFATKLKSYPLQFSMEPE
jgi:ATP-dependent Clp protease adaptor protein ClpS